MRTVLEAAAFAVSAALAMPAWAQDDALMVRGKYLAEGVVACANCHIARDHNGRPLTDKGLSGGMLFDENAFQAYAPNITPDPETGIGKWTDAQLANAIREGIRPDGSLIGPPMPISFYRTMSDTDLAAIIVYLKAQPPVRHIVTKSVYHIPLPPSYGPPVANIQTPPATDMLKTGEYLANIGHCMDCHTPRDDRGMLLTQYLGAGGQIIRWPAGGQAVTSNLTPDKSGLLNWSNAQIEHAIRDGVDKDGSHLQRIMAFDWYKHINGPDMAAIIAYLRSLPAQPFAGKK